MEKRFWIYIMASAPSGVLYVGVTSDIIKRVFQHRESLADGFTKKYHVKKLVYMEEHANAEAAITREKRIKKWYRSMKIDLIQQYNPYWIDLYPTLVGGETHNKIPAFAGMTSTA